MEEGCLKKQRALSDIISDAPDGWPDQSITLRETECAPLPLLLYLQCFCLLRMFELLLLFLPFGLFGDSVGVRT